MGVTHFLSVSVCTAVSGQLHQSQVMLHSGQHSLVRPLRSDIVDIKVDRRSCLVRLQQCCVAALPCAMSLVSVMHMHFVLAKLRCALA